MLLKLMHHLIHGDCLFLSISIIYFAVVIFVCSGLNKVIYARNKETQIRISYLSGSYTASAAGALLLSMAYVMNMPDYILIAIYLISIISIRFPYFLDIYEDINIEDDDEL